MGAKKELKEEGLSDEDADKALDMFKKGDKDGLMKMKKEHDAKKGKKPKKEKKEDKELVEKKKGKKLAEKKKGKKLVTLSEESDEESMEKAFKEFEGASDDDKEKMMKEAKKELKEEGLSDDDADKALDMFKKGDKDGLMKMKKEHDA